MRALILSLSVLLSAGWAAAEPIGVCFTSWEPYARMEDGKATGIQVDIAIAALERLGYQPTFEDKPYARCVKEVELGRGDLLLMTSGEATLPMSTVSTATWYLAVFVPVNSAIVAWDGLDRFDGLRIAMVNGYGYPDALRSFDGWTVQPVSNAVTALRLLDRSRVDLYIDDLAWVRSIQEHEPLKIRPVLPLVDRVAQYVGFAPHHAALAGRYDAVLRVLAAEGIVDQIYRKHLGVTKAELDLIATELVQ